MTLASPIVPICRLRLVWEEADLTTTLAHHPEARPDLIVAVAARSTGLNRASVSVSYALPDGTSLTVGASVETTEVERWTTLSRHGQHALRASGIDADPSALLDELGGITLDPDDPTYDYALPRHGGEG